MLASMSVVQTHGYLNGFAPSEVQKALDELARKPRPNSIDKSVTCGTLGVISTTVSVAMISIALRLHENPFIQVECTVMQPLTPALLAPLLRPGCHYSTAPDGVGNEDTACPVSCFRIQEPRPVFVSKVPHLGPSAEPALHPWCM